MTLTRILYQLKAAYKTLIINRDSAVELNHGLDWYIVLLAVIDVASRSLRSLMNHPG